MHTANLLTAISLAVASLLLATGAVTAHAAHPVLVELFTSEGCSSCPPADALLRRLVEHQPVAGAEIVALEEHVDYWNDLGWTDPFSAARFTHRQRRYAAALPSGVYTPEMVVDGRTGFVGSNGRRARAAIAAARTRPLATVTLRETYNKQGRVKLGVSVSKFTASGGDRRAGVWLAITEDDLADHVTRGENGGRRLRHDAVVRKLERLGRMPLDGKADYSAEPIIMLAAAWRSHNLHAVVFVQDARTRHILGIASLGPL